MKRPALFLLLGLAIGLSAPSAFIYAESSKPANFVAAGAIDPQKLVPPPPAPDSLVQRAEIEVLLNLQTARTPAQITRAQEIQAEDVFVFGSDVLGEWFDATNLPKTAAFFMKVRDDFLPLNHAIKKIFNRRRPPFQDARIKPCVEFSDTSSYPSGHATQSALWAGLLSVIFPEHATDFASRAAETRWARLVGGAHHPTDVEAGRIIGEAVARELLKNPAVQKALDEMRAESAPFLLRKAA
jgi:acid phosphatase (class A)